MKVQLIYNIATHGNQISHLALAKHPKVKAISVLGSNHIVPLLLHTALATVTQR